MAKNHYTNKELKFLWGKVDDVFLYLSAAESVRVIADRVGLRGLLHSLAIRCVIQAGGQRKVTQE